MENGRLLLIPKNLSAFELAEENFKLKEHIHSSNLGASEKEKTVIKAAKILRQDMIDEKPTFSWLPQILELTLESVDIPVMIETLLSTLLNQNETNALTVNHRL